MNSTLKRHKLLEAQSERTSEEDRISSLPSNLIGHILSFLPTKDAVAASVLSTRWKELWTLITCLHFDDYLLQTPPNNRDVKSLQSEFALFVYRVLLVGRFSCIETFKLHCVESYDTLYASAWLASVLTCKVEEIDIRFPKMGASLLPRGLFTCRTLVKLKLSMEIYINVPMLVCLPCLKLVELSWVRFPDDDSITRFLSGCPVLDTLKMKKCAGVDVKVIKICNPLLTSLDLTFLRYEKMSGGEDPITLRIVLDTPVLSHLFIQDYAPEGYMLGNLHKLTRAHICVHGLHIHHHDVISGLLKGISGVQKLHFFTEAIDGHDLPMFGNMEDLVYVVNHNAKFQRLLSLLERSPQLRFLRTSFDYYHSEEGAGFFNEADCPPELELPQGVPNCLLSNLKVIDVVNFQGLCDEVKLVEYFLKNARVLEKLTISCNWRWKNECLRIGEDLRFLPRASRLCQFEFV